MTNLTQLEREWRDWWLDQFGEAPEPTDTLEDALVMSTTDEQIQWLHDWDQRYKDAES